MRAKYKRHIEAKYSGNHATKKIIAADEVEEHAPKRRRGKSKICKVLKRAHEQVAVKIAHGFGTAICACGKHLDFFRVCAKCQKPLESNSWYKDGKIQRRHEECRTDSVLSSTVDSW